ncbi:MAG: hypothetical protein KGH71_06345, partial [Candidatus Micrarchaeota archaeon]|nr:hypothetical protein [Candidatus Micrarchaeota archaeon]
LKVSTAEDYESIKQLERCGNPDVLVKLHCNSSFVSFDNKPLETLKRNLKTLEAYLLENPGMVDGVIGKMEYIIQNTGRNPPELRPPLIYELPPKGTKARSILEGIERDLVRATVIDIDETKAALTAFVTNVFLL